jgi:hypothetical protein
MDGSGVLKEGGPTSSEGSEGGAWISSSVAALTCAIPSAPSMTSVRMSVMTIRAIVTPPSQSEAVGEATAVGSIVQHRGRGAQQLKSPWRATV